MRLARERGAKVLAVTNVMGSQATRDADGVLFTRAGLEIGVAATKTFVAQVAAMYLLALRLAELRGTLADERMRELVAGLKAVPHAIAELLEDAGETAARVAERHYEADFFLYLGRHVGLAVGLEGALKLKEISYIATDAYAAGEMKHGPIALLSEQTPVVVVATDSPVLEKVISNVEEVRARGAHVIAVVSEGNPMMDAHADELLYVPALDWMLQPLLAVIPLQLLAYFVARKRGLNVDQPATWPRPSRSNERRGRPPGRCRHRLARRGPARACPDPPPRAGGPALHRGRASVRRGQGAARDAPRGALLRQGGGGQGARARGLGPARRGGHRRGRPAHRQVERPRRASRIRSRRARAGLAHPYAGDRRGGGDALVSWAPWVLALPDAELMRATDAWAIGERAVPSLDLMERAGEGLARVVVERGAAGRVAVVCGKGNNGGDGLVVARLLRDAGREVDVLLTAEPDGLSGDPAANLARLPGPPPVPFDAARLADASTVVDALLGRASPARPASRRPARSRP
jgi:fructoselysine-6-P-deglycase FrlB-like protein